MATGQSAQRCLCGVFSVAELMSWAESSTGRDQFQDGKVTHRQRSCARQRSHPAPASGCQSRSRPVGCAEPVQPPVARLRPHRPAQDHPRTRSVLADQVRDCACHSRELPVWAPRGSRPTAALLGEAEVWRAAVGVDQHGRPTGAGQLQAAVSTLWQQNLDRAVALCGQRVGTDAGKREVGGPPRDHQRKDRHRMPSTRAVRPGSPPGPRL